MSLRFEAVMFDVADPCAVAAFWAALLGRDVVAERGAMLLPGDGTQVGLRFVGTETRQLGRPRLHLHLTSSSSGDQERTVATALRLGGRHLDVGQGPDDGFVVLADPGGNELCVIDPGNRFLAGTGELGEVTCAGTRAAGLFWRDALDWPLVWDQGEQTAIQSPLGGTKISWDVWDRPAAERQAQLRARQRFDLVSADPDADAARLLSLGASPLARPAGGAHQLADPDGNAFRLRAV